MPIPEQKRQREVKQEELDLEPRRSESADSLSHLRRNLSQTGRKDFLKGFSDYHTRRESCPRLRMSVAERMIDGLAMVLLVASQFREQWFFEGTESTYAGRGK